MTAQDFANYLFGIMIICFVMAGLSLFRWKKFGKDAIWLSLAFLCFGLAALCYRSGLSIPVVGIFLVGLIGCMGMDARSRQKRRG